MTYNTTKPSIYPPYCFDAAPTYNISSFLRIADISSLQRYPNVPGVHFYRNLPIRWVRIVGIIVAIDDSAKERVYMIDDSSGANIECVLRLQPRPEDNPSNVLAPGPPIPPEHREFDVGHVVDLRGPVIAHWRRKAIEIRRMKRVPTTQHEILLWEKRLRFRTSALDKPWVLSDEEIRKYRKEAERADAKDFHLAGDRHNRCRQWGKGDGHVEVADEPYKIKKRRVEPSGKWPQKQGHRVGEPLNNTEAMAREKPVPSAPISKADSHSRDVEESPYSLKPRRSTRPALPTTSKQPADRRSGSSQEDPFRITKRSSRPSTKPSRQPVASLSAHTVLITEPVPDPPMATKRSCTPQTQAASAKSAETTWHTQAVQPAHTKAKKAQNATDHDVTDSPYVIKARSSLRTAAWKPAAFGQNTDVSPFKIVKKAGPSSGTTTHKGSHEREASRARTDLGDPFRINKQGWV
ncbi:uncharacterized protein DNG_07622 [Cephalotrichum gorgonifer]|uniref:CST complex subunit Stn1 N-terminal domain-containing protein n=1 Tax=Cephalotrichum gorgonifer TaxID=2041049 RepID=A0AAE8SYE3_9PEZI|nr:uncharacterized protein DNG_07622 [Cephalotrichum gorgonifer]